MFWGVNRTATTTSVADGWWRASPYPSFSQRPASASGSPSSSPCRGRAPQPSPHRKDRIAPPRQHPPTIPSGSTPATPTRPCQDHPDESEHQMTDIPPPTDNEQRFDDWLRGKTRVASFTTTGHGPTDLHNLAVAGGLVADEEEAGQ